jgi:hypothetical protein
MEMAVEEEYKMVSDASGERVEQLRRIKEAFERISILESGGPEV